MEEIVAVAVFGAVVISAGEEVAAGVYAAALVPVAWIDLKVSLLTQIRESGLILLKL